MILKQGKNKNLYQDLVEESIERKSKMTTLRKNLVRQSQQLIDDTLKNKATLDKDELFKLSLPSFLKNIKQKDIKDITLISLYLVQMKKFMKLFGEDFTSVKDTFYFEQLKRISSTIIYDKFNKNRIVVKFGDEGKKFFLILKGEVQVILPAKKNVVMQQREFKRYLLLLYIYKEYEMLKLVIKDNKITDSNMNFNPSNLFFPGENSNTSNTNTISANNNNVSNNISEEDNKVNNNYYYGYKDFKLGFNRRKSIMANKNSIKIGENNNEKSKLKEIKRIKLLKKLMNYYLNPEEIAYYEKTKNINLKEVDDGIYITPVNYITRITDYSNFNIKVYSNESDPDSDFSVNDDLRANYFIYEYKKLIELQTGDIFGDLALTGNNIKRTASIVSIDECHFACLTRELYSAFIEKGNERIRNNKINYLLSINILKSFPRFILEKKLFNHFAFKNFIRDKYLLKTNEISNDIIFLKDGIFEVSFTGKLGDLTKLINLFYNEYNFLANKREREELDETIINNVKLMEHQKHKIESIFQRFINDEFSYILFLVNAPSIFGFRETESRKTKIIIDEKKQTKEKIYVYHSNICVKCHSSKGEYIYIDKNIFYKHIYGTDSLVQEETKSYVLDFLRKIMKRLLNIRYIKLWNLFLTIGVDKNLNSSVNFEKMQHNEDIYKTVNKLLEVLKEGQLYSNEISKYMSNYFETTKKLTQNQKQLIKLVNENYQKDKLKKLLALSKNKEKKISKNIEYNTNGYRINSTNIKNAMYPHLNTNNKNETEKNNQNISIIKNKIFQEKETSNKSLNDYNFKSIKIKNTRKYRSSSARTTLNTNPRNRLILKNKVWKNVNNKNYFILNKSKKVSSIRRQTSALSTANSYVNRKPIVKNSSEPRIENISKGEITKCNEYSLLKNNLKINDFKKFCFSANRPNSSKALYYYNYFNYSKKRKEKYEKERIKYIIKNTRILFTKTKNLDKIVRIKRVNSVG